MIISFLFDSVKIVPEQNCSQCKSDVSKSCSVDCHSPSDEEKNDKTFSSISSEFANGIDVNRKKKEKTNNMLSHMAAVGRDKTSCAICGKEKATLRCSGCLAEFCYQDLMIHREELNRQLEEIENHRDLLRQVLTEQIQRSISMQEIDQWEQRSIEFTRQTAEQARATLREYSKKYLEQIEFNLAQFTQELRQCRQEEDFNEIHLQQFQQQLKQMTKELNRPMDIIVREESIGRIYLDLSSLYNYLFNRNSISMPSSYRIHLGMQYSSS